MLFLPALKEYLRESFAVFSIKKFKKLASKIKNVNLFTAKTLLICLKKNQEHILNK
jgi:hypothetical protein